MSQELVQRWDAFLAKIRAQFDSLMAEAKVGCLQLLDLTQLDPQAMTNARSGIHAEVLALGRRIDSVWTDKVEPAFQAAGMSSQSIDEQLARGRALAAWLDRHDEEHEIRLFAEAADRIVAAALAQAKQSLACTQCGAPLPVPRHVFRAIYINCTHCRAANTYEPGTLMRQVEHFCCHHQARRAALGAWQRLKEVEAQRRAGHGDTIETLKALEQASRHYWETYFRARAEVVPELAKDVGLDVTSRMRAFYDEMQRNAVWIAHQRGQTTA